MDKIREKYPIDVELFKELFVLREDVYALQTVTGSYMKVEKPLTTQLLKDHLLGKVTIGAYQLWQEKVKWAVIDIDVNKEVWSADGFNMEDWDGKMDTQAREIKQVFSSYDIPSYVENSGFKGRHVWVFFKEPADASLIKSVLHKLFDNMELVDEGIHIELFPKQSSGEYGNLVKLPFAKHKRSGKFSHFIDDINDAQFITEEIVRETINPLDAVFEGCMALNDMKENAVRSQHLGHESRLALSYIFGNLGEEGTNYITDQVFQHMDNYDEDTCRKNLGSVKAKGYKPITCAKLQKDKMCPGPCQNIGTGKSPIVFWYKTLGFDYNDTDVELYDPLDDYQMQGRCYYIQTHKKGSPPVKISNFIMEIDSHYFIDDGLVETTTYEGKILNEDGNVVDISLDAKDFSSNDKLSAAIYSALGNSGMLIDNISRIRQAVNKFTKANVIRIRKIFGYNDDLTKYYSPSVVVSAEKIEENDESIVDLSGEDKAENLDLQILDDIEFNKLKKHISEDLLNLCKPGVSHSALAAAMLPIVQPFGEEGQNRPIYFLRGTTGKGKSFLLLNLQNFFGNFTEPVSWTSTPNSIQRLGYFFKDCMYLVDDYKQDNITKVGEKAARALMQNYADMTGRSRLRSDATMQQTYHIRGGLMISGEDLVSGEASNLARMVIVEYESDKVDLEKGWKVRDSRSKYSGFTARFIQHVLNQDKSKIRKKIREYTVEFHKEIEDANNATRIAGNLAMMMTTYSYLAAFLWNKKEAYENILMLKSFYVNLLKEMVETVAEERSTEKFWRFLQEYLATERLQLQCEMVEPDRFKPTVGHVHNGKVYLIPSLAYTEIQRLLRASGEEIHHTKKAIFTDLFLEGRIASASTTPKKLNGQSVRVVEAFLDDKKLITELTKGT